MNIIRKVGEAARREKAEKKRARPAARRLQKATDAKDATAVEVTRNSVTPKRFACYPIRKHLELPSKSKFVDFGAKVSGVICVAKRDYDPMTACA
jgi:hypothetical protein